MTESALWFLDAAGQVLGGMAASAEAALNGYVEGIEGLEGPDIFFVQVAYGYAPDPIRILDLDRRAPYTNSARHRQDLEDSAQRGWLAAAGEGQYRLTDKGEVAAKGIFALAEDLFGSMTPLPDDELARLAALLGKVAQKARDLPQPAEKWALDQRAKFAWEGVPLMVQVRRAILDLSAFRDDAHVAAWRPYEPDGQIWEAFTYVWHGEATTAAALAEQLPYRGYDEAAYAAALQTLAARGWIAEQADGYAATEKGKALRQEAEDATDRYYDAPWSALTEAELEEAKSLLAQVAKAVQPPEEEAGE